MTPTELTRLLTLASQLPDSELRDLARLAVYEVRSYHFFMSDLAARLREVANPTDTNPSTKTGGVEPAEPVGLSHNTPGTSSADLCPETLSPGSADLIQ